MENLTVLVAEDDNWYAGFLEYVIKLLGDHRVLRASTARETLDLLKEKPDIVTLDFNMPDEKGDALLQKIRRIAPDAKVIVISGQEDVETALLLLNSGAFDYVVKNEGTKNRLIQCIRNIAEHHQLKKQVVQLESEVRDRYELRSIIKSQSSAFNAIYRMVEKAAQSSIHVSITGETGTGKELVARTIHYQSSRARHPFVAVNLSALSEGLIESELFGYVKGAFTGATEDRKGKFEEAGSGTLFLDEIAEISLAMQVKLLRVLQELEISRVGSNKVIPLGCRILTATNKDLAEEVRKGNFRQDLYYRLKGLPIHLPALKDRDNDALFLAKYFVKEYCATNELASKALSEKAIQRIQQYSFPGNVRELKATIELACVLADHELIEDEHIRLDTGVTGFDAIEEGLSLKEINARIVRSMLHKHNQNVRLVARKLGIGKSTIYRMLSEQE
jgi:DNA-binding NtrC family response regulator